MKLNRKSNYYIYLPTNNKKHLKSTKVEFCKPDSTIEENAYM